MATKATVSQLSDGFGRRLRLFAGLACLVTLAASPEVVSASTVVSASNPFSYGECTWYAHERRPEVGSAVLSFPGLADAHTWDERARAKGFPVKSKPAVGTLAIWEAGQKGAHAQGHVAYVKRVLSGGRVKVSDYNWVGHHQAGTHIVSAAGLDFIYRTATAS